MLVSPCGRVEYVLQICRAKLRIIQGAAGSVDAKAGCVLWRRSLAGLCADSTHGAPR